MAYIGNSPTNIVRGRRAVYEFTATAGQTVFTGVDNNGLTLDLLEFNENDVYLNGSRLVLNDDYTVSGDTLTLLSAAALNDILVIVTQDEVANAGSYTKAESDSRYINYDGDIVNGDLQVVGNITVDNIFAQTGIIHDGDTDTSIKFIDNRIYMDVNGNRLLDLQNGGVVLDTAGLGSSFGGNVVVAQGKVGVGVTNPDRALHVGSSTYPQIRMVEPGVDTYDIGVTGSLLKIGKAGATTNAIFLNDSGNVGIGDGSPEAKLTIAGGTADNYTDGIVVSKSGGNLYGIYPSLNNLEFRSVTGNTHIMTMTYGGNIIVGGTTAINAGKVSIDAGTTNNGLTIELDAPAGYTGIDINRTSSVGTAISLKVDSDLKGSIDTSVDGVTYKTEGTPSTEVNTLQPSSFVFKNGGNLGPSMNWDDQSFRNSVFYHTSGSTNTNKPNVNDGVGLYISTYGMGTVNDDASNERGAQLYFGDTRESGMYARVRQGTSGWHDWVKIQNDFAYKEGPAAFQSDYRETWNYGGHWGSSMDATSASDGIIINETGIYIAQMAQRCNTNNAMIGLAVNGDRASYDTLGDSIWGHDHSGSTSGEWSHSIFAGKLQAGWKITGGPPSSYSAQVQYSVRGYDGWIIIQRIA